MNKYIYNSEVSTRSWNVGLLGAWVGGVPLTIGLFWLYINIRSLLAWVFFLFGLLVSIATMKALYKPSIYWLKFTSEKIEWAGYKKKNRGQVLRKNISKIKVEMGHEFNNVLIFHKNESKPSFVPEECIRDRKDFFNKLKENYPEIEITKI